MQNPPQPTKQPTAPQHPNRLGAPQPPDPEERRRTVMRIARAQGLAVVSTFLGLVCLTYPMPFFLLAPVVLLAGLALNIVVIVRTALTRSPIVFYVLASFGILTEFFLLIMCLVMLISPAYWEYRDCLHQSLTVSDQQTCQDTYYRQATQLGTQSPSPPSGVSPGAEAQTRPDAMSPPSSCGDPCLYGGPRCGSLRPSVNYAGGFGHRIHRPLRPAPAL